MITVIYLQIVKVCNGNFKISSSKIMLVGKHFTMNGTVMYSLRYWC